MEGAGFETGSDLRQKKFKETLLLQTTTHLDGKIPTRITKDLAGFDIESEINNRPDAYVVMIDRNGVEVACSRLSEKNDELEEVYSYFGVKSLSDLVCLN